MPYLSPVSPADVSAQHARHKFAYIIQVMGPGGGLGTHIWDIRVIRFTKGYLQVCDSECSWDLCRIMANRGRMLEHACFDQPVCCVGIFRQALTVPSLSPAFQTQQGYSLAHIRRHFRMRVVLLRQYHQQLCAMHAKTWPAR